MHDQIQSPPYLSRLISAAGVSLQNDSVVLKSRFKSKAPMVTCQKIDIRGIRNLARDQVCVGVSLPHTRAPLVKRGDLVSTVHGCAIIFKVVDVYNLRRIAIMCKVSLCSWCEER